MVSETNTIPKLLRAAAVAKLLDVCSKTVLRLAARGELGCIHVGGQVRFTEQQVLDYLERRTSKPQTRGDAPDASNAAEAGPRPATTQRGKVDGKKRLGDRCKALRLAHEIASRPPQAVAVGARLRYQTG